VLTDYPHVFTPLEIGPMRVPNRIFMPPHGIPLVAPGPHGTRVPSEDFAHYYAERAAAGVALFGHSLSVLPLLGGLPCPAYEESIPSFATVAEMVHEHGARIFGQLHYSSLATGPWEPLSPRAPVLGASSYQRYERYDTYHELTTDEIAELVAMYGRGAAHLLRAGYDGVQIHAAHGVLMEQFLSPYFNRRTDGYGGDLTGRMRLLVEALQAVRDNAGPGLAVGVRLVCDEFLPGGLIQDDIREIVVALVDRGLIDFADMDIAVEPQQPQLMTTPSLVAPLHLRDLVAAIRKEVSSRIAVISSLGRVTKIADAERMIAEGVADMVGAVRGLIAEPELVRNAREGREDRSRTCIACNYCIAGVQLSGSYGCTINPASGRERRWGVRSFTPATNPGRVVIAGGGPAGLEAARVGALRGHDVVLLERRDRVGGQLALWATAPGREVYQSTVSWYERELDRLGVDVRTGVMADRATVLAEHPDAAVVAAGSRYATTGESGFLPAEIPGHDRATVHTPEQVLASTVRLGGTVVILDDEGIQTGVAVAEVLAGQGAEVHFVTRHAQLVPHLAYDAHLPLIMQRLVRLGVHLHTRSYLREIGDDEVIVFDVFTDETRVLAEVNAVVLATMRKPQSALGVQLVGQVGQVFLIGDAMAPRGLAEATYEGHQFARLIGEPGAARTTFEYLLRPVPAEAFARPAAALRTPTP
jgi:2,4-dienoyl-CoA reductase-like NADH-dependent reductase (Old Yellow Enzyme family)/pyruvate/2-oxoglutarate dehydrogenase complex dihydrolipoamide dehydrogenase (E3) component